ncbi:MAG: aconitate hydratase AcnA, partial [Actinomycetota bacterium]|nr:aconitate hydratase AcnA [Actinomycetota bacterium]
MNSFGARGALTVGADRYEIFRLGALESDYGVSRLPYSLKVLLENLLRYEGTTTVSGEDVDALAGGETGGREREIAFLPARILLQDFTGVPAVADLAAMREAVADLGGDPAGVNPRLPAELVVDHSVVVDAYGTREAFARNTQLEFGRNRERYRFLRWGQQALSGFRVVPPGKGICHQVNLEYLARVVFVDDVGRAYPDTVLGTDSHTPMVNGLGVVGWGVGGIEAEAALLGQPTSMLVPEVVGVRLTGALPEGSTATDLVLTVTEMLRGHGVVGKFVEFYGPGVANVPVENRATIGNMSPEYGSTVTMFPIDEATLRYLTFTGRPPTLIKLVEAYAKEQGLWHDPQAAPVFSESIVLDLSTVVPSIAGPARPQDRVSLDRAKATFRAVLPDSLPKTPKTEGPSGVAGLPRHVAPGSVEAASVASFPASDPPAAMAGAAGTGGREAPGSPAPLVETMPDRPRAPVSVRLPGGPHFELDHGHVVIAAITSCTNTSNPSVMLAAGLLAKKAVERGLRVKPWVKTSLAPGSTAVVDYLGEAGLLTFLEHLGFYVVGFGCTTCIGNSGPLAPEISRAIAAGDVAVASVLSGNRNFEGRIHPEVRLNYLMSPPLVVAYALAGTIDVDVRHEPLGLGNDGRPVYLRDVWPTAAEVEAAAATSLRPDMFGHAYGDVFVGDEAWESLDVPPGERYGWERASTYVRRPPFLEALTRQPAPVSDVVGARALVVLGHGTTTDHISPAGAIPADSPAGRWLTAQGVD